MGAELLESTCERSDERYRSASPVRESVGGDFDVSEEHDKEKSKDRSKHRSKDRKKSRSKVKDHRGRDQDRSKTHDGSKEREKEAKESEKERQLSKEKRKEGREEHEKDRPKGKGREKDHDRDKLKGKDCGKDEKDRERKRDRERERENEPESNRDRGKGRVAEKGKEKEREKDKGRDRDKGKDREKPRDKEKEREKEKSKDRDAFDEGQDKDNSIEREGVEDYDRERLRARERSSRRGKEDYDHFEDGGKDSKGRSGSDYNRGKEKNHNQRESSEPKDVDAVLVKQVDCVQNFLVSQVQSQKEIEERILRMKEQRLKNNSESASEILSWVNKSRKLEERRDLEKEKAKRRSKIFDEQDNVDDDDEEGETAAQTDGLAGVKVLHGIDKVLEGGSVVLTLKDQDILANGDVNKDVDMLENVEIGEQKRRNEAYKAAKRTASYDEMFNDQPGKEKKMLPLYDDPAEEEGVTLDVAGRFTREAEKKLEEMRRKFLNPSLNNLAESLTSSIQISSDYFTPEEMLQFKKPKKKKSLRKRDKLDIDALEAEARAEGLGSSDLGSRNDSKRQAAKEEEERAEAMRRTNAYQAAFAKADEASRALRMEQAVTIAKEEEDAEVFSDDAEDLRKSLEQARKLALKKQNDKLPAGPEAVARLASSATSSQPSDAQNSSSGDALDNKVVFTEMEEFVWGLQLDEESQKPNHEDVFMEEDEPPKASTEQRNEPSSWVEVVDSKKDEPSKPEDKEEIVPDDTLHEAAVGKGLASALKLLKERGELKEKIDWGGRNMDKKKGKLVGIHEDEGPKEIHLERLDEFGRTLTPKEAFRLISHKFHGKGPGKMKLEKRIKSFQEDQKRKKLASSNALPESVERMREAQLQLKTPYLVLSGHVKPGQTSDPRSGFATVEKQVPGSLTPMLGDEKVENWMNKRKAGPGPYGTPKKPKT